MATSSCNNESGDSDLEIIYVAENNGKRSKQNIRSDCKKRRQGESDRDDEEIKELFTVMHERKVQPGRRARYYDDETIEDPDEVFRRWNIKHLCDPNVNLSATNYRYRVFRDTNPIPARKFKPGIFITDDGIENSARNLDPKPKYLSKTGRLDSCSNVIDRSVDEKALNDRIDEINSKLKTLKDQTKNNYDSTLSKLQENVDEKLNFFKNSQMNRYERARNIDLVTNFFDTTKIDLKRAYNDKIYEIERSARDQERALRELFESGNYEHGRFSEYTTLEVYQPATKRRRFDDDGQRKILLPETDVINILIEDEIYNYYYGQK